MLTDRFEMFAFDELGGRFEHRPGPSDEQQQAVLRPLLIGRFGL